MSAAVAEAQPASEPTVAAEALAIGTVEREAEVLEESGEAAETAVQAMDITGLLAQAAVQEAAQATVAMGPQHPTARPVPPAAPLAQAALPRAPVEVAVQTPSAG